MEILLLILLLMMFYYNPVLMSPVVIALAIFFLKKNKEYKKSAYYQVTKCPFFRVRYNIGRYGEYLTYQKLKHMEQEGAKFLFNVYVPKDNGETTEIDVLMICRKGIFVLESKNYSGWIFGSEHQKNWYQTLPTRRGRSHKEQFYNPVMQNRSHIKHLQSFLGEQVPMRSVIVFSERCTLKSVDIKSSDICVVNRYDVASAVLGLHEKMAAEALDENGIAQIYEKLYPFTQVDEEAKKQHIENIKSNLPQTPAAPAEEAPAPEQIAPEMPKCPRCGGTLILRTATRGANAGNRFYGCSNYPKCKYVQNLTTEENIIK